ncbi:MAG TPA: DUF2195 family protein [Polyangiales bacterium]|nr:DUF2195 family protein [Polyangiales bacterium]
MSSRSCSAGITVILGALLVSAAAAKSDASRAPQVNASAVKDCVSLTLGELEYQRNIALVHATLRVMQPLTSCYCVSNELKYVAYGMDDDAARTPLAFGKLQTFKRQDGPVPVVLIVASDRAESVDFTKVSLNLDCQ